MTSSKIERIEDAGGLEVRLGTDPRFFFCIVHQLSFPTDGSHVESCRRLSALETNSWSPKTE